MALDHAIMISLAERPGTGYELGRQFSTSLGHFWPATRQQIYRTLNRLHTDGLVTCEDIPQQGRPDKKVYSLAPAGRDALASWIAEPSAVPALRDSLGVKLRGAEHGDLDDVLTDVRHHRATHAERLALYRGYAVTQFPDAESSDAESPGPDRSALTGRRLHQYLVLRGGIRLEDAFVAWCDEVLETLAPVTSTTPVTPVTSVTTEKS